LSRFRYVDLFRSCPFKLRLGFYLGSCMRACATRKVLIGLRGRYRKGIGTAMGIRKRKGRGGVGRKVKKSLEYRRRKVAKWKRKNEKQ